MNFLAHAYLSGEDKEIITGNFIADRVKGNKWKNYPPGIQHGILLHRFIDDFTDRHPANLKSSRLLSPYFGKFSGVVTDVMNDHLLSISWKEHHHLPLDHFIRYTYKSIQEHHFHLPEDSKHIFDHMESNNWLGSYVELDEIVKVLWRMSKRTRFESGMDKAGEPLKKHFNELYINFKRFFPELRTAAGQKKLSLSDQLNR